MSVPKSEIEKLVREIEAQLVQAGAANGAAPVSRYGSRGASGGGRAPTKRLVVIAAAAVAGAALTAGVCYAIFVANRKKKAEEEALA